MSTPRTRLRKGIELSQHGDYKASNELLPASPSFFNSTSKSSLFAAYNAYYRGLNYNALGDYENAIEQLQLAKKLVGKDSESLLTNILFELGKSFKKNHDYSQAIPSLNAVINTFTLTPPKDFSQKILLAESYLRLGLCLHEMSDKLAFVTLDKSLLLLKKITPPTDKNEQKRHTQLLGLASYSLASLFLFKNYYPKAILLLKDSITLFKKLNSTSNLAQATLLLAITYVKYGNIAKASSTLDSASFDWEIADKSTAALKQLVAGLVFALQNNHPAAIKNLKNYLKLVPSLAHTSTAGCNLTKFLLENFALPARSQEKHTAKLLREIISTLTNQKDIEAKRESKEEAREIKTFKFPK